MTHLTIDSLTDGSGLGFLTDRIKAIRAALRERSRRRQAFRNVKAELDQYSAEEITELGISRADIELVAENAAGR